MPRKKKTPPSAPKTGKTTAKNKDGSTKKIKAGATKRKIIRAQGQPVPPDETKVKTAADAKLFWENSGSYELTQGMILRVEAWRDVEAFPEVKKAIEAEAKKYADRLLPALLVTGAETVAGELGQTGGRASSQPPATDEDVQNACSLVISLRGSIVRLHKGARNATVRHAFGTDVHLDPLKAETVIKGLDGLLDGKEAEPRTAAGRFITAADVAELEEYRVKLRGRVREDAKEKKLEASDRSKEQRQQAGLELFYDRFAAATNRIHLKDPKKRQELLSLVPRDETKRAKASGGGNEGGGGQPGDQQAPAGGNTPPASL